MMCNNLFSTMPLVMHDWPTVAYGASWPHCRIQTWHGNEIEKLIMPGVFLIWFVILQPVLVQNQLASSPGSTQNRLPF